MSDLVIEDLPSGGRAMSDLVIEDLPGDGRGIVHNLAVSLGLAQPTPGERAADRPATCWGCIGPDNSKEAGGREAGS
jgi:hypothetical protein